MSRGRKYCGPQLRSIGFFGWRGPVQETASLNNPRAYRSLALLASSVAIPTGSFNQRILDHRQRDLAGVGATVTACLVQSNQTEFPRRSVD
jgi:hypothetical protein